MASNQNNDNKDAPKDTEQSISERSPNNRSPSLEDMLENAPEDTVMSFANIHEFFQEEDEAINTSIAVLGTFSDKQCSYDLLKVPQRQAIFACATCKTHPDPETGKPYQAGFCYACSVNCHKDHEIFELWTKRNFNCDCGTDRYITPDCQLFDKKGFFNDANAYNHNFDGHYCVCNKEPFPEEFADDPEMAKQSQCVICEDWFHLPHIEPVRVRKAPIVPQSAEQAKKSKDDELFCLPCIQKNPFLAYYLYPGSVERKRGDKRKLDDMNALLGSAPASTSASTPAQDGCKLLAAKELAGKPDEESDTFKAMLASFKVFAGWRELLCRCDDCRKMYEDKQVEYLIDQSDSINDYVKTTEKQRASDHYEEAYKDLSHVQKIGIITLKQKLNRFFSDFYEKNPGKVLTVEDVNKFVEKHLKRPELA